MRFLTTLALLGLAATASAQEALKAEYTGTLTHGDVVFTIEEGAHYFSSIGRYRRDYLVDGIRRRSEIIAPGRMPVQSRSWELDGVLRFLRSLPTSFAISWDWRNFTNNWGDVLETTSAALGERQIGFVTLRGSRTTINFASGAVQEREEWTSDASRSRRIERRIATSGSDGELIRVYEWRLGSVEPVEYDPAFFLP